MSSEPFAIEFRNVSLSFDDKRALDDISFRLERGQMICITGVSGSGKSVLLRVGSGLLTPDEGEVLDSVSREPLRGPARVWRDFTPER